MASITSLRIPDIGDFSKIPVIEILVKVGDSVTENQALLTLESDKASMEVPASASGRIVALKVKVGDEVSEGDVFAEIEADAGESRGAGAEKAAASERSKGDSDAESGKKDVPDERPAKVDAAAASGRSADIDCQVIVIGAGPGGYTAAFRAADLGQDVVLVERYETLGGVCLNVGCIPSKALLHTAAVIEETRSMADHGVSFGEPKIDVDALRGYKEKVVGQLTKGLSAMAKQRKVRVLHGKASFESPHEVIVENDKGSQRVSFKNAIIAAGSQSIKIPGFPWDDPRMMDSTGALELKDIPKTLLVVGGGIIGMEMACVYSGLGSRVTVVEMMDQLMPGADPDLVRPFQQRMKSRLEGIHLKTKVTGIKATDKGLVASFEGDGVPESATFDRVLVSVGRSPNGGKISADKAGVEVSDRGFISVDKQMRTNVDHIFAIGDLVGQPMLAHKASHEGKVAAEVAAGEKSEFVARVIPSVAYTDPEIAWVGVTEIEAKAQGIKYGKGVFPWAASGRAIGNNRTEGFTKLLFDEETHRVIGAGIVGTHAGELIAEVVLAIEMGCEAADISLSIHPHPTLSESVAMAAEVYEGTITDLYIPRKK